MKQSRPLVPLLSFHLLSGVFSIVLSFSCHNFLLKYKGGMEEKGSVQNPGWKIMTSRINIRQLRSHTDCAQRWKSAVIRLEKCYKTKSGTYNNLVIKRSTFQLPRLKERLIQSFTDIRNTGVGHGGVHRALWAVMGSLHPGFSPAGHKSWCWGGSLPKVRSDSVLLLAPC